MTAIDIFYHSVLFFNEKIFVFIFLLSGYFLYDKRVFTYLSILTLFATIFNAYLKSIWQIPLNPDVDPFGWAYPSGHTHTNMVMWLSFILLTRRFWLLFYLIPFFITCYFGMIHFKYHVWADILGGICAGMLTVIPFYYWIRFFKNEIMELAILAIMVSAMILMISLPEMPHKFASDWRAFGGLIGLLAFKFDLDLKTTKAKVVNILISLALITLIQKGINIKHNPPLAFATGILTILLPLFIVPKIILGVQNLTHGLFVNKRAHKRA